MNNTIKQKYRIYLSKESLSYFQKNEVPMSYIVNHLLITQPFELINLVLLRSTSRSSCKPVNITLGPYANELFNKLKEENGLPISPMKYVPISLSRLLEFVYSYDLLYNSYDECEPLLKTASTMQLLNEIYINSTKEDFLQIKETLNGIYPV